MLFVSLIEEKNTVCLQNSERTISLFTYLLQLLSKHFQFLIYSYENLIQINGGSSNINWKFVTLELFTDMSVSYITSTFE
jgi:hypothetical protein